MKVVNYILLLSMLCSAPALYYSGKTQIEILWNWAILCDKADQAMNYFAQNFVGNYGWLIILGTRETSIGAHN